MSGLHRVFGLFAMVAVVAVSTIGGCQKNETVLFDKSGNISPVLEITPADFGAAPGFTVTNFQVDIGDPYDFSSETVLDSLSFIRVVELTLTLTSDSPVQNFDWATALYFTMWDASESIATVKTVAELETVPAGSSSLTFHCYVAGDNEYELGTSNLLSIITAGPIHLTFDISGVVPPGNIRLSGTIRMTGGI